MPFGWPNGRSLNTRLFPIDSITVTNRLCFQGIHGLTKLLNDNAPSCVKEGKFEAYFGRKIAVDASNHIYQFMVAVGR